MGSLTGDFKTQEAVKPLLCSLVLPIVSINIIGIFIKLDAL